MSDGVHIRWRETAPDRGLLSFALSEIDALHSAWPETMECNIIIERALPASSGGVAPGGYRADIELDLGRRSPRLQAVAVGEHAHGALRSAFESLRERVYAHVLSGYAGEQAA